MAAARTNFVTHKGRAVYPWLTQPDTKFHSEGQYKTGLRVPADQAQEIIQAAQTLAREALGPQKAAKCRMPFDSDPDTGEIVFIAKSKYKPKFVDSQGNVIPDGQVPRMYGGSVLKLKGSMTPYDLGANFGVTMNLSAVQVIEPVTELGDDASFEAVEDGFTVDSSDDFATEEVNDKTSNFNADF